VTICCAPAANALGHLGDEEAVTPLAALLNESGTPIEAAASALVSIYDRYQRLYGEGAHIADLARLAINASGAQTLLDRLTGADTDELRVLARVLGWLEGAAVERALTWLLGKPDVRKEVIESLINYGPRVVDLLIEQIEAEDIETRQAAVIALGRIGDRRATLALARLLTGDMELTVVAAGALAKIGDRRAFEPLLSLLGHSNAAARQAVISALNSLGHPELPSRIAVFLNDPDPRVRESAVKIAGYFGYPECADLLLERASDADENVRRAAIDALISLTASTMQREAAISALAHLPAEQIDLVGEGLKQAKVEVRRSLIEALGRMKQLRASAWLSAALDDDDASVRLAAATALGHLGNRGAEQKLMLIARSDPDSAVRRAAYLALHRQGIED
jgi:HEAT repeat protein